MTGSISPQTLTIAGTGFQAGLSVILTTSGSPNTYLPSAIVSVTATQIQVPVTVGATAHSWTVQVVNPGGAASNTATLTVTAPPPPAISSLSPNPMPGSASPQTLTINGSGFAAGATVSLTYTGGTTVNPTIASISATQIAATVNVGTTARAWAVQVVNPSGAASNAATLTVTAPVTPVIASLSPNPMTGSSNSQTLTIKGSGFQAGLTVTLTTGATTAAYQGSYIASVTATQVQVSVNVGTAAHNWTVQVANPGGVASNTATLTVTAALPPPAVVSLNPNAMTGSASPQTLTINGTGFQSGIVVGVQASNTNTVTAYAGAQVTVTPTQLKIQVNVGTTKRPWYLQLVNPDGQYSNVAAWQVD